MSMKRLIFILAAPLLLASCLLTPGKFVSTLDIKKDRTFTFTYAGEIIVIDQKSAPTECDPEDKGCNPATIAAEAETKHAEQEAKFAEIGEALGKEAGYRSVEYLGEGKYRVDYAISGKLDRTFLYPFNSDAKAILPWLGVEIRNDGTARIKAPGFGEENDTPGMGTANPLGDSTKMRDGTFTLTTDAEIVMQNEESGVRQGQGGAKTIVWKVTPTSEIVPTAVLRFSE